MVVSVRMSKTDRSALIKKLLCERSGINLDVGCGSNKQEGFVGLDIRPLPGVEIVHDFEQFPYPLPGECCNSILCSHVVEHVAPHRFGFINFMNELWRISKPGARLMIATPYAGSHGYWQDPTHCNPCNETTFAYFDPSHPSGLFWIYQPKPWRIVTNAWHANGNLEVVLEKLALVPESALPKPEEALSGSTAANSQPHQARKPHGRNSKKKAKKSPSPKASVQRRRHSGNRRNKRD